VVVAPTPVPPPAAPEEIPLQLLGTIVGRDHGIAICLNPTTRDVIRLKMGEDFQGWVLRAVQGREAAFEKASLQVRLTLPSPDESASFESATARPQPLAVQTSVPASETWTDGDGQMIAPPPFAAQAQAPASATWRDGDGQLIVPPPKSR
jgi:hypothetical protein